MPHPHIPLCFKFTLMYVWKFSHNEHRCASWCWCSPTRHTTATCQRPYSRFSITGNLVPSYYMDPVWHSINPATPLQLTFWYALNCKCENRIIATNNHKFWKLTYGRLNATLLYQKHNIAQTSLNLSSAPRLSGNRQQVMDPHWVSSYNWCIASYNNTFIEFHIP